MWFEHWEYRRGDVYYADLSSTLGAEICGIRPALVIQNDVGNQFSPTLIVAPITSRVWKNPHQPTHFYLEHVQGLYRPGVVLLEQIRTIDKQRIVKYVGKVDPETLNSSEFRRCFYVSLGLIPEECVRGCAERNGL